MLIWNFLFRCCLDRFLDQIFCCFHKIESNNKFTVLFKKCNWGKYFQQSTCLNWSWDSSYIININTNLLVWHRMQFFSNIFFMLISRRCIFEKQKPLNLIKLNIFLAVYHKHKKWWKRSINLFYMQFLMITFSWFLCSPVIPKTELDENFGLLLVPNVIK